MKSLLLTSYGSRRAGGLFATMQDYSKALQQRGVSPVIMSLVDEFWERDKIAYENVKVINYHQLLFPGGNALGFSIDIHKLIADENPEIIHQQGIWMYYSHATLKAKQANPNCKVIIEPHGMLDPWAVKNSAWKKKIVGRLFEYRNLSSADCIHALCKSEYESIRQFGLKNPIAIIPNGIVLPTNPPIDRNHEEKILLFIGRIHPKKGLVPLIEGLYTMNLSQPKILKNWTIRIAGWGQNGHLEELKLLVEKYQLNGIVKFIGPVTGKDKESELCKANAFILPSFSEGLPMSVLEAWAYKLPVVMTKYCNLPEGFDKHAAVCIDTNPQSISDGLQQIFTMRDNELSKMGNNGFLLVKEQFSWGHIADQTIQLYNYMLKGGNKPNFVYD
ncbi:glycosyltransferase [Bacteroides sp. 224]|uniref:glycosyltransferase n=1 Tax=Bacteroides sp. 224 TaxID=2302936 RepID=UPI0013D6B8B6|nr:glycosyltransferase [Bacteroides sp. 224]NDV66983.1 glycosyltransferase [Bacteroides sp. 224]